ncbi:nondiscriminating glutamyl-tRNA synthetase EARS2, mitochondrial [Culicoides brevitarsis]|uniref:nondiscriminating glutamyl-tRNA synthetase EARS2, mitochondrial n=1 Tax=Culicoides brevitarsis TaxID=469753 RepID=UPI00307C12DA
MLQLTRNLCALSLQQPIFTVIRGCHTQVRVRFAPSPTGYLHLGGLRTALYNYLFAKKHGGKFILRIEDTDQTRLVDDATEQLCKDLEWAGIKPDEGPNYGGLFGPYIQSQRIDLYHEEVKKLLSNGSAYYCFCSERRLDLLRKEALKQRQVPKYDNRCRHLTPVQIAEKLANKDPFCIRFKLESQGESFNDMVYGKIVYFIAQNEGDPIIIKSDGYPTYHFANVVDDHYMRITHVLRGVEWQISTPKHLLMYQAFGWKAPRYGHLPLIMNTDGSKLSKRQNDIRIQHYQEKGIFPQALLNYITQSGGGFEKEVGEHLKCLQMPELVSRFDISKVNANSSRLNPELLGDLNRLELQEQLRDPVKCDILIEKVRELVTKAYPKNVENLDLGKEHVKFVLEWAVNRITSLNELVEGKLSFLWILPKLQKDNVIGSDILESLIKSLNEQNFSKTDLNSLLKEFSAKNDLSFANFMKSLRGVLSGLKEGPSVAEMMEILGKEGTVERLLRTKKK